MSQGILKKLDFTPGVNKNRTELAAYPYWVSCDKVRFRSGVPEKMGGWQQPSYVGSYLGIARAIHTWSAADLVKYTAVGTHKGLFLETGGQWYDITPVIVSDQIGSVMSATSGSDIITVSVGGLGINAGDSVVFPSATSVGNVLVSGRYDTVTVAGNYIEIQADTTADADYTKTNVSTGFQVLLADGNIRNTALFGYGRSGYSTGGYSQPVTGFGGIESQVRTWTLQNWGDDLLAMPRDNTLFQWIEASGVNTRAVSVSDAPSKNATFIVTEPTRHVMVFGTSLQGGAYDPMGIRWTSNENFTIWDAATTNAAGDQVIQGGSLIIAAEQTKLETLVLTDEAAHTVHQADAPFYFRFDKLADNCGVVSQNAAIDVNGVVYWMGLKAFWRYDGQVEELNSTLDKVVFKEGNAETLNFDQKELVFAGINSEHSEIIWLYPAGGSNEINRYVIYNYLENLWYDGTLERTTWRDVNVGYERPLATGVSAGSMFEHEVGADANSRPLQAFIKSSDFGIEDGDTLMFVDQIVPDFKQTGNLQITLYSKKYPNGTMSQKGPYTVKPSTNFISTRIRGRSMAIEYNSSVIGGDFEVGAVRIRIQPDGER